MDKLKMIFQQTMMVSFGIVMCMGIEGIVYRADVVFRWYHPISIVITGLLCSFASLILYFEHEVPRRKYVGRIILHFALLFVMVMGLGWLFKWYTKPDGAIFLAVLFFGVYIFVWVASFWMGSFDQKKINSALDGIRDDE